MNLRIYIQKKNFFDLYSRNLYQELNDMDISLSKVIIYHIYDIFQIKQEVFIDSLYKIFVDPVTDIYHKKLHLKNPYFSIEYLPGKYDQRAEAAMQCIKVIDPISTVFIKTGKLIELIGLNNQKNDIIKIKKYCINPNICKEKNLKEMLPPDFSNIKCVEKKKMKILEGFINFTPEEIKKIHKKWNFSIGIKDLLFIQKYFFEEKRDPKEEELRILDAYWSDHCRHSTFLTTLVDITFDGILKDTYYNIFNKYLKDRDSIGRSKDPINLMDLSNLPSQILSKKGKLKNYVFSNERNSCIMRIDVDIIGKKKEKWYLLFKNETHNHPTEIDPFGGAATCIGGAIRDPLSGRAFVYQSIRLSGADDPTKKKTLNGKIEQRKICREAANGYSSYGNQVGVATTHIHEIYHKGYKAKRMEVGMVIGAVPVDYVKQKNPKNGDIILLIGGLTGRDGIGGATESSKEYEYNFKNTSYNIQVQKGNPIIERQIQRFFRKKSAISLIKKCNDLGAGGASVAIGELSNSSILYLDKIPIKNTSLDPIEIALSESQERMVVVLNPYDVKKFINLSHKENILSIPIARITDNERIIFYHKKKEIFNLKSSFLNTGGSNKKKVVQVSSPTSISPFKKSQKITFNKTNFLKNISKLNIASQKSLVEMFDSTIGGGTILMPFGGKYQMTPSEGSVQKIPVLNGETTTVSLASWGYHPNISTWSPLHGGAYAIVECVSKIVSMGGNYKSTYFSFQEYYQKLGKKSKNWGKPFASLLGAYHAQMAFELASIGGKDSMSGSYKNIHVPPTLIAFGVSIGSCGNIISPEFKKIGNRIYLYHHKPLKNEMPDFDSLKKVYDQVYEGICSGKIVSVKTIKDGGISIAIAKMSFGNRLGVVIQYNNHLLETNIGSLIIESSSSLSEDFILIGEVVSSKNLNFNGISIDIDESIENWIKTLTPIYSIHNRDLKYTKKNILRKSIKFHKKIPLKWKSIKKIRPHVFIPIFPGTNCEFESIHAFEKEGAIVKTFVLRNLSDKDLIQSISKMVKYIKSVQIFMLCGGFSAGDEPDGSAKFITSILHNPYIKDSIEYFIDHDGLILGICNGFQALIKSSLLPYGKINLRNHKSPTLTYNKIGKHISQCVHIKVISDQSPWLKGMKNKVYTIPVSHSEGRFYANEKMINILLKKNQIATLYVDLKGNPTMDFPFNPNGSIGSVEGLLSNNGKIYGRMTHPERYNNGLLKNIPDIKEHSIFRNAVQYFL
ncbi:phosphoribosylformylglycinamidine synthase [Blattabacterium sp. (Cryptocercus punctulatus) str. Cpu]|uniref:phosphoribosylformylglycinamidine synthase n=1 Tax=Blattabacterium sp. (Cryptocercus punctulatus) str. Cpu TaxID=1075399 RepID=UPI0002387179|nr:phosphoribosylformylglycinamidine synthase [Blattabacterium sp. (Cryptocercus punctulatus) str. Cpu]AEU09496.1 phosphoribosylformylglycinamidine synthase [Blattabacterium sp. (Cryptocercus punctulatus) str. Cpu]